MPSTRISMCLISACECGISGETNNNTIASLRMFIAPPFTNEVEIAELFQN